MITLGTAELDHFKARVYHWSEFLGLNDWQITVLPRSENVGSFAQVVCDLAGMTATIYLIMEYEDYLASINVWKQLDRSALHECLEIMLYDLGSLSRGIVSDGLLENKTHSIIRRFENALIPESEADNG